MAGFRKIIWKYYCESKRPMSWRKTRDPYRILVSEIMLQQTQVSRVVGFYEKFIKKFPDFRALARARTADILRAWQGLGYNRRALALQRLAREVLRKYGGRLPRNRESLEALPGVGPYTAGAIRAFAFNEPEIFIETNIRRVFIHFFFSARKPLRNNSKIRTKKVTDAELMRYIEGTLDQKNPREWYFALMDYGAMLGGELRRSRKGEKRAENPNRRSAHYVRQATFAGSDREIRGKILRTMLARRKMPIEALSKSLAAPRMTHRTEKIMQDLVTEGFLTQFGRYVKIAN